MEISRLFTPLTKEETQPTSDQQQGGFEQLLGQAIAQALNDTATPSQGNDALGLLGLGLVGQLGQSLNPAPSPPATPQAQVASQGPFSLGGLPSLADLADLANPLQHIPLVSDYYQQWTGDTQGYVPQLLGGTLYGGALGGAGALMDIGLTRVLGQSPVTYLTGLISQDDDT
ncbi:hypothetical protein [Gallaecimonas xiamenensis]|uniref:Uncharacterized protein n=1 Tax=Gallaecimonas xiamenensis 3-C-1 TaxID=745411 RepID=K2JJ49_9GAMM|nr:hypothetical protein [Gallaecimonas xiamenensis]EKE70579.1 hypothetical protein B3C1_13613 [Gallaecimonas xiamenensis 3-C-1]